MAEKTIDCANGPLPGAFDSVAYFTEDRREWALPKQNALAYLDWCEQHELSVLGFEVDADNPSSPFGSLGVR
jgi:hypothetical protein